MPRDASRAGSEREVGGNVSPHILTFLRLTRAHDQAVRSGNEQDVETAREQLQLFYGSLKPEEREGIEEFAAREILGKVIEDQRGWIHRNVVRALHIPHRLVGASVEPIAKLSGRTVELVAMTLGWTVRGMVRGFREAFRGTLRKAA